MTHAADALKGLAGAARELTDAVDRGSSYRVLANALARSRAALSAFEGRARLRDDRGLREAIGRHLQDSLVRTNRLDTAGVLDLIESALLGTPGTGEAPR